MHSLDEVVDVVLKAKFTTFFTADASCGYWAVPIKPGDEYKAAVITPHGQYAYRRMGMGLKNAMHIYAQFTDMVFGPLPRAEDPDHREVDREETIIGDYGDASFSPFVDDYIGSAVDFDAQFTFLHEKHFPRVIFGPVYLAEKKVRVFESSLEAVGFEGNKDGIRPSIRQIPMNMYLRRGKLGPKIAEIKLHRHSQLPLLQILQLSYC